MVVSSNAKVDYKMDYITVRTLEETRRVHISEIGVLMLESTAISITAYALCELLAHKVKVIFCDHQRNPYRRAAPQQRQPRFHREDPPTDGMDAGGQGRGLDGNHPRQNSRPARCAAALATAASAIADGIPGPDSAGRRQQPGGHAAKVYFNALFGKEFSRALDTPENAALNYGYGLILSAINREIAAAGYLTQLGVFHDNVYNAFNLGCDLMEPLRPLIDNEVMNLRPETFEKEHKHALIRLLQAQVRLDGKQHVLLYALRLYCASVFRALQSGKIDELRLIEYEL